MVHAALKSSIRALLNLSEPETVKVLLVDDEAGLLKVVKKCLESRRYLSVETANSVEKAKDEMATTEFDVIVSDYQMPGKNGLEFLEELRKDNVNIPFIIFTGKGREEVAIKALNLGADRYINKTGDPETVYFELAYAIRQVVELRKVEEQIKESEEKFRLTFENAKDAIFWADPKTGLIINCNKAAEKLLEKPKEEIIGQHQRSLHPPAEREKYDGMFQTHITNNGAMDEEGELVTSSGKKIPVHITGSLTEIGKYTIIQGIFRDITERKKTEEALRKSERNCRRIVELSPESIVTVDRKGVITSCNSTAIKLLGYSKEELVGKHFSKIGIVRMKDLLKYFMLFRSVLRGKAVKPLELSFTKKDGSLVLCEVQVGLLKEGNRIIGVQAISRDITDKKIVQQALQESQLKFMGLFKGNPEAAVYVGPKFRILDINPRFTQLFGYSLNEIKGAKLSEIIVPENRFEEGEMLDEKAKKGHIYFDTVRKRKDGSLVNVSISAAPIWVEERLIGYVGLYKDITDQKKTEAELKNSREHFQTLFNLIVDPVVIVDGKGKLLEVTKKAEEVTGYGREELVGKNFLRLPIATAKTKGIMMKNLLKRLVGKEVKPYEVEIITKEGAKIPLEINGAKINYKGQHADMVIFRDISGRKKLEEKLRVVGKLTRHDVRNKLSVIAGNIHLAKGELRDSSISEFLKDIEQASKQIETIFDFARNYEKLGVEKLFYLDVCQTLDEAISLHSNLKNVKIKNSCKGLSLYADSLLRQLFYNLIDNSLKHGKTACEIRVYFREEGDGVKLIFEDNGVGIPFREKKQIFKEGYGADTGYGLYLIRKICEVYGWTIRETGTPGIGAQFTISVLKSNKGKMKSYRIEG